MKEGVVLINNKYLSDLISYYEDVRDIVKYENIYITKFSPVLVELSLLFMQRSYEHVNDFHNYYKAHPKENPKTNNYCAIERIVKEQLDNMPRVQSMFLQYFTDSTPKTKSDLLTFIYAHQINKKLYYIFLYKVLRDSLKMDCDLNIWNQYIKPLDCPYLLHHQPLYLWRGHPYCIDTGKVSLTGDTNIDIGIDIINKYIKNQNDKLELIKELGETMLTNYSKHPYKSSVSNIIASINAHNAVNKAFTKK